MSDNAEAPLTVYGEVAKFRSALTRRVARGRELLSLLDGAESRYTPAPPGASGLMVMLAESTPAARGIGEELSQWENGIYTMLHKHLGAFSDDLFPHRQRPYLRVASTPERFAAQRSFLETRLRDLDAVWQRVPGRRLDTASPPAPMFPELRASGLLPDDVVEGYIRRMSRTSKPAERSDAIGAVKELLEAVFKATLDLTGTPYSKSDEMATLGREVRRTLKAGAGSPTSEGVHTLDRMFSGLGSVEQALTELRNAYGSGHGRTAHPEGLAQRHALLAIDACVAHVRYLVLTLQDLSLLMGPTLTTNGHPASMPE